MRYRIANHPRNVIGLRSVVLVTVKQVVEGRILLKIRRGRVVRQATVYRQAYRGSTWGIFPTKRVLSWSPA